MGTPYARWMGISLITLVAIMPAVAAGDEDRCRKLYRLTDIDQAIEPGISVAATEALPAHCRVRGVVNRAIRFEVTLPDDWNDRMMFTAVGGGAGVIGDTTSLLARGFAMASTDTGHEIEEGNAYLRQPEALLDYAYRGVHLATQASKRIIAQYYGREADRAYLQGCSNGGRAALLEAERFPADYDGIIAGAPAFRFQEFLPWMVAVHNLQDAHPLTKDAFTVLDDASRGACDAADGVEDGVINDPRTCKIDVDALVCGEGRESPQPGEPEGGTPSQESPQPGEPEGGTPSQNRGCLTAGQAETARFIYGDMVDEDGNVLSPGVPPGAESSGDWGLWLLGAEQFSGMGDNLREMLSILLRHDPTFDVADFDPVRDQDHIADAMAPFDVTGDLRDFRDRGGKILMYQGWNDFPLRPQRAIDYLAALDQATGGPEQTAEFFRLFMVPGMVHCAGGPGPWQTDYVDPIVKWTEEGEAPERLVATHPAEPTPMFHLNPSREPEASREFTRPLCVYPKLGLYRGEGDPDHESSFRCAVP